MKFGIGSSQKPAESEAGGDFKPPPGLPSCETRLVARALNYGEIRSPKVLSSARPEELNKEGLKMEEALLNLINDLLKLFKDAQNMERRSS